jgi:release factor glutamine methyltransferase
MTIKEIHTKYLHALQQIYSIGEASKMTEMIFENIAKISKQQIIINCSEELNTNTENQLLDTLEKLLQHYPVQYIIGESWFYNLKFIVNENVLIPRSETEELVEEAILFLKNSLNKNVIDIGTGSGCIPISIKKNIETANVISVDISEGALDIAKQNALANSVIIDFKKTDFLDNTNWEGLGKFDLIISNPPYIPEQEEKIMDKNVTLHEPHIALFVPQNAPLLFYKKILSFAKNHLATQGKIMLEIHEDLAKETAEIFTVQNYCVEIKKDMQDKDRMLIIYRYP